MKESFPKNYLSAFLRILIGGLFIFSFQTKIVAMEPIEALIIQYNIASWKIAPFLSRFILASELALAIAFIFNITRKWTFWSSQLMLFGFTIFLTYLYVKNGDEGDCGCFGNFIQLTPLESIAKNILWSGLIIVWYFYSKEEFNYKPFIIIPLVGAVCLSLPYILNFPSEQAEVNYPLDLKTLGPITFSDSTKPDFTKGEYILAFLSLKCKHCVTTAHLLDSNDRVKNLPKIYNVFIGKEERLKDFQEVSTSNFPYYIYPDPILMKVTGPKFPLVMYLKDGIVKYKWENIDDNSFHIIFPYKKNKD